MKALHFALRSKELPEGVFVSIAHTQTDFQIFTFSEFLINPYLDGNRIIAGLTYPQLIFTRRNIWKAKPVIFPNLTTGYPFTFSKNLDESIGQRGSV